LRIEQYPLEKYLILKTVKNHTDYSTWKVMNRLRKIGCNIARSSFELFIRNLIKDGYIELVDSGVYKNRKSYSILLTKKGLSKLSELEVKIRVTLTSIT
jgi:predicted transcriptional regulator